VSLPPGAIRDSIIRYLSNLNSDAALGDISAAVAATTGKVPASSIRSYLNLNVPDLFERTGRGRYRLKAVEPLKTFPRIRPPFLREGAATLYHSDCFAWLAGREPSSIHAVVTDPPYGLLEYTAREQARLRNGKGGVWRIPPSFDGHRRAPLPRFTVLDADDRLALFAFFKRLGGLLVRVTVPGANIVVASNPLLFHIVAAAMSESGLEPRGTIVRLTTTMRGGDRPKNAHAEFANVSVMPRSMWEPWVVLRKPIEGRVQDNLRKWRTGGFLRPSTDKPFGDVIRSSPTSKQERAIAPHPSLKPQEFLRRVVKASLPMGEGTVLDPFAGSGSTLAAANAVGYPSIGVESDAEFVEIAATAIARLGSLSPRSPSLSREGGTQAATRERTAGMTGSAAG
jgi:DNA modification methylase